MPEITAQAVQEYLGELYRKPVRLISLSSRGTQEEGDDLKGFGYGSPLFLEYEVGNEQAKAVLETMAPSSYGHDHFSDRAQTILWEHGAFNSLPRHVRSLDSGAFLDSGAMLSTGHAREFFILTEFVEGSGYFKDLERIRDTGSADENDFRRVVVLSDYLFEIHREKKEAPGLYKRRLRDLIGHGECIMGIIDNYPESFDFIDAALLEKIEQSAAAWRWKIKSKTHRLCRVHGDFHPWNILFRQDLDFSVLDRSRGEWGEPADDTSTMSINYIFFSLQQSGGLSGAFEKMFHLFWDNYLGKTGDEEMLEVIAPFFVWRALVVASPLWYPHLSPGVRRSLFNFIRNVLAAGRFDPGDVNRYLL